MISEEQKQYAKELLQSAAIASIFDELEASYTEAWKGSSITDTEFREDKYRMIRALHDLRSNIYSIAKGDEVKAYNSRLANNSKLR